MAKSKGKGTTLGGIDVETLGAMLLRKAETYARENAPRFCDPETVKQALITAWLKGYGTGSKEALERLRKDRGHG